MASSNLEHLTEDEVDELLGLLDSINVEKTFLDFEPHAAQEIFMTSDAQETLFFGANQIGKTEALLCVVLMFATGEYPAWFPVERRMPIPNRGRLSGPDLKNWVMEIIEPKLARLLDRKKYLLPGVMGWKYSPQTKSVDQLCFKNGSVIDLMSYQQEQISFESWTGNWAAFDEPPPRDMYIATVRGLAALNGKTFLSLTPLTQPWIGQLVEQCKDIKDFYGKTYREGTSYIDIGDGRRYATKVRIVHSVASENLPHLNHRQMHCGGLTPEGLAFFKSTLKPDEVGARLFGEFVHLQGLIYKELQDDVHIISDDAVPSIGSVYCVLDPADAKPHAVAWFRVDPMGTIFCIKTCYVQGNLDVLARNIKQIEQDMNLVTDVRLIDPQKGHTPTAVSGATWQEELDQRGLYFETDVNNDIPLGHQKVKAALSYDTTKPMDETNRPKLYFARQGASAMIFSLHNYIYQIGKQRNNNASMYEKPEERYKDLPDCLRYLIMFGAEFLNPIRDMGENFTTQDWSTSSRRT